MVEHKLLARIVSKHRYIAVMYAIVEIWNLTTIVQSTLATWPAPTQPPLFPSLRHPGLASDSQILVLGQTAYASSTYYVDPSPMPQESR